MNTYLTLASHELPPADSTAETVQTETGSEFLDEEDESERSDSAIPDDGPDGPGRDAPDGDDERGYKLPLDQIFEIMKNERRRETIRYLQENGGETTLSDVAEHIAALENDTTVRAISSAQRKRVYVGLYQCHLPKMDDADVIDFEKNRGTIEIGPNAEQLARYLDEPASDEWHRFYMAVTLSGAALFIAAQAGGASFGLTPTVILIWLLGGITVCYTAEMVLARNIDNIVSFRN